MLSYRILLPERPGAGDLCSPVINSLHGGQQLLSIYKRFVTELKFFGVMTLRICVVETLRRQNHIIQKLLRALEIVYDALLFKCLRMWLSCSTLF